MERKDIVNFYKNETNLKIEKAGITDKEKKVICAKIDIVDVIEAAFNFLCLFNE